MKTYKQNRERPDLTVVAICPGWVKTGKSCVTYSRPPSKLIGTTHA